MLAAPTRAAQGAALVGTTPDVGGITPTSTAARHKPFAFGRASDYVEMAAGVRWGLPLTRMSGRSAFDYEGGGAMISAFGIGTVNQQGNPFSAGLHALGARSAKKAGSVSGPVQGVTSGQATLREGCPQQNIGNARQVRWQPGEGRGVVVCSAGASSSWTDVSNTRSYQAGKFSRPTDPEVPAVTVSLISPARHRVRTRAGDWSCSTRCVIEQVERPKNYNQPPGPPPGVGSSCCGRCRIGACWSARPR
jgi:hypothetical protein